MKLFKVIAMIFCFLGFPSVPKIIFMIGNVTSTTSIYFKKWDDINKYSIITAMTAIKRNKYEKSVVRFFIIVFLINKMDINGMLYIKAYGISIQIVMCTIDL